MAVLIFCLNASFWNSVVLSLVSGFASLNLLTCASRMACCGCPVRNQYVAPPPAPPAAVVEPGVLFGPELPQAVRPAASAPPPTRPRKVRRDVVMGSTVISVLRAAPTGCG